jgi:RimJ/RimL family protein N-acetyltransferase
LELLGEKIKLKSVNDSDIDEPHRWWNDPEFAGESAGFSPKGRAKFEELVKGCWYFMVESRTGDRKIGFIAYYPVRSDYLNLFEIGYRTKPAREGEATQPKL